MCPLEDICVPWRTYVLPGGHMCHPGDICVTRRTYVSPGGHICLDEGVIAITGRSHSIFTQRPQSFCISYCVVMKT